MRHDGLRGTVARANPLALCVVGIAAVPGSLAIRDLSTGLVALGAYLVAVLLLTPSVRYALICLALAGFAGLTVAWSTWRLGGHDEVLAATAALRIVVLAWPGAVVAGYIDPTRLGDHLGQNLRLPARPVVATTASMQQLGALLGDWQQIDRSRRARGVGRHGGPLVRARVAGSMVFALLVTALRAGTSRAIAMDARGFDEAGRRSWAAPAPWSRLDVAAATLGVLLAAVPVVHHLLR